MQKGMERLPRPINVHIVYLQTFVRRDTQKKTTSNASAINPSLGCTFNSAARVLAILNWKCHRMSNLKMSLGKGKKDGDPVLSTDEITMSP